MQASAPRRRLAAEFLEHARHGQEHWQPFMNLPWLVDAHADDEHHEVAVDLRAHAFGKQAGHSVFPPF
jgi:hypothetical protein